MEMSDERRASLQATDHGSIITVFATTGAALNWLQSSVPDDAPWLGWNLCVERAHICDLLWAAQRAGLTTEVI